MKPTCSRHSRSHRLSGGGAFTFRSLVPFFLYSVQAACVAIDQHNILFLRKVFPRPPVYPLAQVPAVSFSEKQLTPKSVLCSPGISGIPPRIPILPIRQTCALRPHQSIRKTHPRDNLSVFDEEYLLFGQSQDTSPFPSRWGPFLFVFVAIS